MLLCLFAPSAKAVDRQAWYLEDLSKSPPGTAFQSERNHVGFSLAQMGDSASVRASALLSFRYLELQIEAGQIYFGFGNSQSGVNMRNTFARENTFFAAELSRYFIDSRNYFGRLSVKLVDFEPGGDMAWRPALQTGVVATASQPWSLEFSVQGWFYFKQATSFVFGTLRTGRTFYLGEKQNHTLQLTGSFSLAQKMQTLPGENMVFTIGPTLAYGHASVGTLSLGVPFRIWLDREITSGGYGLLSQFDTPAVQFQWLLNW